MDNSVTSSQCLLSSTHLENVEALIKNLEKQTISTLDNFEHVIGGDQSQFKSFITSSITSSDVMNIDDNFLIRSITEPSVENYSTDSLFSPCNLFGESVINNRNRVPTTISDERIVPSDQSIVDGFHWDDHYDTRQNYHLTFSGSKQRPPSPHHHIHHPHKSSYHRLNTSQQRKKRTSPTLNGQPNSTYSDELPSDTLITNLNDWSMRSSFNLEQSTDILPESSSRYQEPVPTTSSATLFRSQSHPLPAEKELVSSSHSPGVSSTTSSSSSTSWKRMKESQRASSDVELKKSRPPSPFSLYRIFQKKASMSSTTQQHIRSSVLQPYRHLSTENETPAVVANPSAISTLKENLIDGGGIQRQNQAASHSKTHDRCEESTQFPPHITDQCIQTSISMSQTTIPSHERCERTFKSFQTDNIGISRSSRQMDVNTRNGNTHFSTKSESVDRLQQTSTGRFMSPSPNPSSSNQSSVYKTVQQTSSTTSATYKSLPDLSFISQYSKETPRTNSQTTSLVPSADSQLSSEAGFITSSNSTSQQQEQQSERPRTLKSIKRYKNSKHPTEPCVFYNLQLRKTFAAIPTKQVQSKQSPIMMLMVQQKPQRTHSKPPSLLKSCLKHRANSCDIASVLRLQPTPLSCSSSTTKNEKKQRSREKSKIPTLVVDNSRKGRSSSVTSALSERYSESSLLEKHEQQWQKINHMPSSSKLLDYVILNSTDDSQKRINSIQQPQSAQPYYHSDYDLRTMTQTKKSVSFSENIAKHLISPCNPSITFSSTIEREQEPTNDSLLMLHEKNYNPTLKTLRYGAKEEMRRCQTDIIIMDPANLHSFTDSPPNEFRLEDDDGKHNDEDDDQAILEKTAVMNYIENDTLHTTDIPTITTTTSTASSSSTSNIQPIHDKIEQFLLTEKENVNTGQQQRAEKARKVIAEIKPEIISFTKNNDHIVETKTLMSNSFIMNSSTLTPCIQRTIEALLESVTETIKQIYEIKRADKSFFLNNELNPQLDHLLKNDFCLVLRDILENGLKHQQQQSLFMMKQITLWKIIDSVTGQGQIPSPFYDAKIIGQNIQTTNWFCRFQAFIYALLNKSELINWLYHYMRQKDLLLRYYDSSALLLVNNNFTFSIFERLMTQFEKLLPLAFRLKFISPSSSLAGVGSTFLTSNDDLFGSTTLNGVKDCAITMSRQESKTLDKNSNGRQPIIATIDKIPVTTSGNTIRSTLSKTFNMRAWFRGNGNNIVIDMNTKKGPTSAVTTKLPGPKYDTNSKLNGIQLRTTSPRSPPLTNVFKNNSNHTTNSTKKPTTSNSNHIPTSHRGLSPVSTNSSATTAFQSKIPRPSLNVDKTNKPLSARYCTSQNTTIAK